MRRIREIELSETSDTRDGSGPLQRNGKRGKGLDCARGWKGYMGIWLIMQTLADNGSMYMEVKMEDGGRCLRLKA